jgi:YesN/AraC family two-component response regulator
VVLYMQSILQNTYAIRVAKNGQEGLDMAFAEIPDIIISDVMMPERNGYEVCDLLKNDERTSHIPIILLTAKSAVEDKITGLKVGADAYLMKPFHKEELLVRLEKLLELRRVLQKQNAVIPFKIEPLEPSARFETAPMVIPTIKEDPSVQTPILEKKEPKTPTLDDVFLQKIRAVIDKNMDDTNLGIADLCKAVNLSHTQVFRKMKAITGENPTLYIRKMRLQRGLELLNTTELNVSEIAYDIGFTDPSYFSRAFSEEFGTPPSAMRK